LVTHLAAEELIGRHISRLAGNIPQGVLDDRHCSAIGLKAAALADFQHATLYIGRVFAYQRVAEMQNEGFQVGFGEFDFAKTIKPFSGDDAYDGVAADDSAAEVCDLHWRQLQVRSQECSKSH